MPILILVNKSSVPQQRVDATTTRVQVRGEFQVMIERRPGYQAALVKVTPSASARVYRVALAEAHNLCRRDGAPVRWPAAPNTEVHTAWLPERARRTTYVAVRNPGDHECTLACACEPEGEPGEDRLVQSYPPFPGMPRSAGAAGWADRWHALPLTPALIAAKRAASEKIRAATEEYDVQPAVVERVIFV